MASRKAKLAPPRPAPRPRLLEGWLGIDPMAGEIWGERLRRLALGLTAALACARPLWPSEIAGEADTGQGLTWTLAAFWVFALFAFAQWVGGATRLRFSRADAAAVALPLLVGLSSVGAAERRIAVNLAWEMAGVGFIYVLMRNIPRTSGESSALAACSAATAVAVAGYGLYQVFNELPAMQEFFLRNPRAALARVGLDPNLPPAHPLRKAFENRLLRSNEPWSTFALANSLAGFLVGPIVVTIAVGLEGLLRRREKDGPSLLLGLLAATPLSVSLYCLLLTKSRSAYLALVAGLAVLAWRHRHRVGLRKTVLIGLVIVTVLGALAVIAVATGGLDKQVLTESTKSLGYRLEYWRGAWGVIGERPWSGHGPGNFGGPYLRHKLPRAGEQISDPHNLVLDMAAMAGVFAALTLVAALGLAFRDIFGPSRETPEAEPTRPPGWVLACGGMSPFVAVVLGAIDPIREADLFVRWVLLASGWWIGAALTFPFWRRARPSALAVGAGALAVVINLLAAGGIGMPAVAVGLWSLAALGQNLRDDRPCGRLRLAGGRWSAFGLLAVAAAAIGWFLGAILPFWQADRAVGEARWILGQSRANIKLAEAAYLRATDADVLGARPWLELAELEHRAWRARGARGDDRVWPQIGYMLDEASRPPRNPRSKAVESLRARIAADVLDAPGVAQTEAARLRKEHLDALIRLSSLDPTDASIRAELARALAGNGQIELANREAREAIRLDDQMPHADKKLPEAARREMSRGFGVPPPPRKAEAR